MSEVIHLELDCVNGEKLIIERSTAPDTLIVVSLNGQTVAIKPLTFWLAVMALNDTEPSAISQLQK